MAASGSSVTRDVADVDDTEPVELGRGAGGLADASRPLLGGTIHFSMTLMWLSHVDLLISFIYRKLKWKFFYFDPKKSAMTSQYDPQQKINKFTRRSMLRVYKRL